MGVHGQQFELDASDLGHLLDDPQCSEELRGCIRGLAAAGEEDFSSPAVEVCAEVRLETFQEDVCADLPYPRSEHGAAETTPAAPANVGDLHLHLDVGVEALVLVENVHVRFSGGCSGFFAFDTRLRL